MDWLGLEHFQSLLNTLLIILSFLGLRLRVEKVREIANGKFDEATREIKALKNKLSKRKKRINGRRIPKTNI